MFKVISFTLMFFLFAAGSYAQPQFIESYKSLSQGDRNLVDSIVDGFLKNHIIFLGEISQARELIGAAAVSDTEVVTEEKLPESHYELDVDVHEQEHLVVRILSAKKGEDGAYHTPVKILGGRAYSYKVLYKVEIEGDYLAVSSSKLSDKRDSRIEIDPDPRLMKSLAESLKGEVSGNRINLP